MATSQEPLFKLTTTLGERLKLHGLSAYEELSQPFEFVVAALAEDASVDIEALLGTKATVSAMLPNDEKRHFNGIVAAIGLDGTHGKKALYRLVLRPWLWLLTRRTDTRIFQNDPTDTILKAVFSRYTNTVRFDVAGSLPSHKFCVQYRESDFNFVSRLMEQEGLYYFFKHSANGHEMVITNKMAAHTPFAGYAQVPFRDSADASLDLDTISDWRTQFELQPGQVKLDDYDFIQPGTSLAATSASTRRNANTTLEHYDPPGDYKAAADGERKALLRMQELDARYARISGSGNARGIAAGSRFTLKDHPVAAQNAEHVVISTRIDLRFAGYESGADVSHFHCSFQAMPGTGIFRPQRITPKPVVPGPQTAVVVGVDGQEIDTDEHGRVKLHFHWDRLGERNETSSCWVRVSHPLAGKGFGMIALPRIGQEVVVDFLEGDPDRPLVTGRVYNQVQQVPYALPANKTVSTLKTRSTMDGSISNFNELRFEDKKDSEYIWFQAEKDYYQLVKHDAWQVVGNDQFRLVKNDLKEEIKGLAQRTIGKDLKDKVVGDQHLDVGGKSATKVAGNYGLKVTGDLVMQSDGVISAKSGADMVQKVGANLGVDAAANVHIKGGANVVIEAGAMLTLKCGGGSVVIGPANVAITGTMVMINSGGGAGSGSGASPKTPEAAQEAVKPEAPADPLDGAHR